MISPCAIYFTSSQVSEGFYPLERLHGQDQIPASSHETGNHIVPCPPSGSAQAKKKHSQKRSSFKPFSKIVPLARINNDCLIEVADAHASVHATSVAQCAKISLSTPRSIQEQRALPLLDPVDKALPARRWGRRPSATCQWFVPIPMTKC